MDEYLNEYRAGFGIYIYTAEIGNNDINMSS